MNEMYEMSLSIHEGGVLLLLIIFLGSLWQLRQANDLMKYLKKMRIQSPLIMMAMFVPIFTGMVMMAAKHLEFSVANIVMIVLSVVIIIFEIKRSKPLKYASIADEGAFEKYKKDATSILVAEMALIVMISIWMYL
jgi:hypothetical protein